MKYYLLHLAALLLYCLPLEGQHHDLEHNATMWAGKKRPQVQDTLSLLQSFKSGTTHGHFRYYFMATDNAGALTDYYANAIGGGIRYETASYQGVQFCVSGFYIFNIGSSDFTVPDPLTGQGNRYELALFDVEDPNNESDIDRLEELYLKYNFGNSSIILGRQLINTPFINLQDGRMRPTGVQGVWWKLNEWEKVFIEGGWLNAISPRATVEWFKIDESIGVYPTGLNTDGTPSGYAHHLTSKGVGLLGIDYTFNKYLKIKAWDMYIENISNTAMLQADVDVPLPNTSSLFAAGQAIRQNTIKHGGNENEATTYAPRGSKAFTFGVKAGWKDARWEISLNYNRITKEGRYLVPREWGREPFFTFLPRERNEGFGDVQALMGKINYKFPNLKLKSSLGIGKYQLPDVQNYTLNKYGLPSYTQINLDLRKEFSNFLEGLDMQYLFAYKINNGETYNNHKYLFNKVDMMVHNLILNYHF